MMSKSLDSPRRFHGGSFAIGLAAGLALICIPAWTAGPLTGAGRHSGGVPQPPPGHGGPPVRGHDGRRLPEGWRPLPPLFVAIDRNRDGELSASEIKGAAKALLVLDEDGDQALSCDELRPPPPPRLRWPSTDDCDDRGSAADADCPSEPPARR
jgi:hypothetical protein